MHMQHRQLCVPPHTRGALGNAGAQSHGVKLSEPTSHPNRRAGESVRCLKGETSCTISAAPPVEGGYLYSGHGDNEERNSCGGDGGEGTTGAVRWEWLREYIRETA